MEESRGSLHFFLFAVRTEKFHAAVLWDLPAPYPKLQNWETPGSSMTLFWSLLLTFGYQLL